MYFSCKNFFLIIFPLLLICAFAGFTACGDNGADDLNSALTAPHILLTDNVIGWSAVQNADSYEVYENNTRVALQHETSFTISRTAAGTYKYKVKALSADKNYSSSKFSNEVIYTVQNKTQLAAPQLSYDEATKTISWTAVQHADGYNIYENGELFKSQAETTFTVTHTETGMYNYAVKATSTNEDYSESELSNEVSHIISEKLATPEITYDEDSKTISWTAVEHADSYAIYENGFVLTSRSETTYVIAQTKVGEYDYYIRARSDNATVYLNSEKSDTVHIEIEPTVLATPSGLEVDSGNLLLSWTESEGASTYEIYEDGILVSKQPNSPYSIPFDHEPGTFNFTVKALPAKNDKQYVASGVSEPIEITIEDKRTQLAIPSNLHIDTRMVDKNPGAGDGETVNKAYLVWDSVPNADAYFIYKGSVGGDSRIAAVTGCEYVISEIMPGTHSYKVQAIAERAKYISSELSEECKHEIPEDTNTTFTIHLDKTNASDFNSSVIIGLFAENLITGLPIPNSDANHSKITIPAGKNEGSTIYTNKYRYIAKITNLPSGYFASTVRLSPAVTEGTIKIYKNGSLTAVTLDNEISLTAKSGAGGNVGAVNTYLFIAPKEATQYWIVADSGLICTVGDSERYSFYADKNDPVIITANCQKEGTFKFKVVEATNKKQYINFGEIGGYEGATGPSNTIYGQSATFYLHASDKAMRYAIMFTTATMSNTTFVTLTVNGKDYEFDGAYFNQRNILIPASSTDTEIKIKISGEGAGEGLNVSFYVMPLE